MEVFQAIQARHTIREFTPEPLEPAMVQKLISAGFAAPSNDHMRQWHFITLDDRILREKILSRSIILWTAKEVAL